MIRHLTPADYRRIPWANGRGITVEMLRVEENGALQWRLSRATVVEDGDFSIFPEVNRSLTVISGPGFDLVGAAGVQSARPFIPVAFAGDVPVRAVAVTAPSDDFNVMTARRLGLPQVTVIRGGTAFPAGGTWVVFALGKAVVSGVRMGCHDLVVTDQAAMVDPVDPVIVVRVYADTPSR